MPIFDFLYHARLFTINPKTLASNALFITRQVVAGTNYFMKVDIGGGHFIHLRVFKGLPHNPVLELHGVQQGQTADSPLKHFQE